MSPVLVDIEMLDDMAGFRLPTAVNERLQELLDRQDSGQSLSSLEQSEAEGLVELSEWLSLLRQRASRLIAPGPIDVDPVRPASSTCTGHVH